MDITKLKGRSPYPFETIAAAVAFSPRMDAILAEAGHLSRKFQAKLVLIHVGPKTSGKEDRLKKTIARLGIGDLHHEIVWRDGPAASTLLDVCKEHVVDLLVLGALKKESLLKFYVGSLARTISRKAKCSVLLVTQPGIESKSPSKIIVTGVDNPKTIHTINTAVYFARTYNIQEIRVVREVDMTGLAMTLSDNTTAGDATKLKRELAEEEEDRLHDVIKKCKAEGVNILEKTVRGKSGFAISKYARDKKADLLVINSPDQQLNFLDRIFTHDMEYILQDLPCDLLIVHSRIPANNET